MVILRPTRKLQMWLPIANVGQAVSDTALGDWYVNRVVVKRRPLLILVSSASLLPVLVPARNVRELPARLGGIVEARVSRFGLPARVIEAEKDAMGRVVIGPALDRSILGIMVEFARALPYHPTEGTGFQSVGIPVERGRARNPPRGEPRLEGTHVARRT